MKCLIVGAGPAGLSAAETLRKLSDRLEITVADGENKLLYARCQLPGVVAGRTIPDFRPPDFFTRNDIGLIAGKRVLFLWPDLNQVLLEDGSRLRFQVLLLATGARPRGLKIPGTELRGIYGLRQYGDALRISRWEAGRAVVLGGGPGGVAVAEALRDRGIRQVTLVVKSTRVLSRQMDEQGAGRVEKALLNHNIELLYGQNPRQILGSKKVQSVGLEDGRELPADLVIAAKGVQPNISLAVRAGAGVRVNPYFETARCGVFAAGDCTEVRDELTGEDVLPGRWTLAIQQGKRAAQSMFYRLKYPEGSWEESDLTPYTEAYTREYTAQIGGVPLAAAGWNTFPGEVQVWDSGGVYRRLVFRDDKLLGAVIIGDIAGAGIYNWLIRKGRELSSREKSALLRGEVFSLMLPGEPQQSYAK